jgi:DNA polymerase family A
MAAGRLDREASEAGKVEGMRRAEAGAPLGWIEQAVETIRWLACRQPFIVSDDVWARGLVHPGEARALGPCFKRAQALRIVEPTERCTLTSQVKRHRAPIRVWKSLLFEPRKHMNVRVFDTETCLFRPGVMAPELVCVTYQVPGEEPGIFHANDPDALARVRGWLLGKEILVGHHVPYDFAVLCAKWPELLPLVFKAYDDNRITDTKIRQQLLDIAGGEFRGYERKFQTEVTECSEHGDECEDLAACTALGIVKTSVRTGARFVPHEYSLDAIAYRATGRHLDKDTWRLRYGEFLNVPLAEWPEGARIYPLEDARATFDVYLKQEEHVEYIPDQFRQARAGWSLHLTSTWGLRTHAPGVDKLEAETISALAEIEEDLKTAGLVRANGKRNLKAARTLMVQVCEQLKKPVRLTDKGHVCLDSDACEASQSELLEDYAELTSLKNVLAKDIPVLRAGTTYPVHTSFGMAASGRSTSAKPNVQNPRRLPGIRETFIPRPGKVFAQGDFSGLELHTLAQVCVSLFGQSRLAEVLNEGFDPHTAFAADILGISYEEADRRHKAGDKEVDNARQTAKVANFGFPGGLGAEKLCLFARKTYNVLLTEDRARDLKAAWLIRWPEMQLFFHHVGDLVNEDSGKALVEQLFSKRWRGGCHYTAACNTYFQGLGADAAKRAAYLVTRACYAETTSVLYGSRPVNFVHDEVILETDDVPGAHDVAMELGRLMVEGANEFLPNVPARVAPLLARCWSKKSKPVYENGRLVPWAA